MNVSIGHKWEEFVEGKVKNGDYQSASEVVREGLRLLEKEDLFKRISVHSLEELQEKLQEAVKSLESGGRLDGEESFVRLRQRTQKRRGNG